MPTKRQLSKIWETEMEFPETRRTDDPAYKRPEFKRVVTPPCSWHTQDELGYLAAHEDADKRTSKGERQTQCHVCSYWFWPHEFGIDPISKLK